MKAPGRMGWALEMLAEACADDGVFRAFVEESGKVAMRKLKERGFEGVDPSKLDPVMADQILRASWIEAAITCFPGASEETIVADLNRMFDAAALERSRTADGTDTAQ